MNRVPSRNCRFSSKCALRIVTHAPVGRIVIHPVTPVEPPAITMHTSVPVYRAKREPMNARNYSASIAVSINRIIKRDISDTGYAK